MGVGLRTLFSAMNHSQTYSLIIGSSLRSFHDENWEETEPLHVRMWASAARHLREREILVGKSNCKVTIDWMPLAQRYERHYKATKYLEQHNAISLDEAVRKAGFPRRPCKVPVTVSSVAERLDFHAVAASVIHDVFLIMNIAAPGSCNFYRARLVKSHGFDEEISLSSYLFEIHLVSRKWPLPRAIELENVISWYDLVRQGVAQIPNNPIERALFALLHLAGPDTDAISVVWLFYAIESLLQTRAGENFSAIVRRLSLLLDADAKQTDVIKRELRKLYDIRSAIVHGGFEILHPLKNELLDKRAGDAFGRLLTAMDFGYAAIIRVLQKVAENGWTVLRFDEVVAGSGRAGA